MVVRAYCQVIGYKQRLEADECRRKAMDKHLVFLVKQTERYRCRPAPPRNLCLCYVSLRGPCACRARLCNRLSCGHIRKSIRALKLSAHGAHLVYARKILLLSMAKSSRLELQGALHVETMGNIPRLCVNLCRGGGGGGLYVPGRGTF